MIFSITLEVIKTRKMTKIRLETINPFGEQLRFWRKSKGFSQLDLAVDAEVSSKHISFLETGRNKPSRSMVLLLSGTLELPLRSRNDLLLSAGFSENYSRTPIHEKEMTSIRNILEMMLAKHEPYPAVVLDWGWNVLMGNDGYNNILESVKSLRADFSTSSNIVELIFDPKGLKPFISNWEEVASFAIQRLHREKMENKNRHEVLLERLLSYPGTPLHWRSLNFKESSKPIVYVEFKIGEVALKFFTTLSSFGTPIDVTAEEIVIEQYFPADEATKLFFEKNK